MSFRHLVLLLTSCLVISNCAVMQKKDCERGNWQDQGYKDAKNGYDKELFQQHKEACLKHSYTVDEAFYWKGYDEGLKRFCTFKGGYEYGKDGHTYKDTCPLELETDFYKGYIEGQNFKKMEDREEDQ